MGCRPTIKRFLWEIRVPARPDQPLQEPQLGLNIERELIGEKTEVGY